jgi:MoaA/NifB/PqqE/SkfB family radical SAM enzyme
MLRDYRVALNLELSSKCNARCAMCPRDLIAAPANMTDEVFRAALARITPRDVFRVVLAGYGEPTAHPRFCDFLQAMRGHAVPFDLVTNGSLLDERRLAAIDGAIRTKIVSFSSEEPSVYEHVHAGLDLSTVMQGLERARRTLRSTQLAISLTPLRPCLDTLPRTIAWLRSIGIDALTMSPTVYDRASGSPVGGGAPPTTQELRAVIREHGLRSQELDFVPSALEIGKQWLANRHKCIPRNTDLLVSAQGQYMYCFNDIRHSHPMGDVHDTSVREALRRREKTDADPAICGQCAMRDRYRFGEVSRAFVGWLGSSLGDSRASSTATRIG